MSIIKKIERGAEWCIQKCPICGQENDMVIRGDIELGPEKKRYIYPDIGYSFCNCHSIFYTTHVPLPNPIDELKEEKEKLYNLDEYFVDMPDPFFVKWDDPYQFIHWNPRKNLIIWDIDSLCETLEEIGYEICGRFRNLDPNTPHPMTSTIIIGIPEDCRAATKAAIEYFKNKSIMVAEIGIHNGRHAKLLLKHLFNISKLYLIDFWKAYPDYPIQEYQNQDCEMTKNVFRGNDKVEIIIDDSIKSAGRFADNYFDFVYIDAAHDYNSVKNDILTWKSKVKPEGILAGHDYDYKDTPGIKQAVDEIFGEDKVNIGLNTNNIQDWWIYL